MATKRDLTRHSIAIPPYLKERFEKFAAYRYLTLSDVVREAMLEYDRNRIEKELPKPKDPLFG